MTTLRAALTAVGCSAAALTIAACGPLGSGKAEPASTALADQPASVIGTKSLAAMKSASTMTVDLDGITDGKPMKYHMAMSDTGDCQGNLTMEGGNVRMVKSGPSLYMKGDDAFWSSQGADGKAAQEVIGKRWMKTKASGPDSKEFLQACDLKAFLAELDKEEGGDDGGTKGEPVTVDGTPALPITGKDGAETITAYIATQGKPYMLKVVTKGGKEPGTLRFTDFDKPVDIKAPAAKDVVDIDKLGG
ncbi:hypothetical protein ACIP98_24700 [Streptomyces sp. NPDC088354]|uniref:hypothetical protein n=1 Tax=Streptomyces sp. NPDC088354 TaxID=3365856 RepID=UPI00382C06EB